jgi:hypothetical protein
VIEDFCLLKEHYVFVKVMGPFQKESFWMKNEIVKKRQKTKVMRERD